MFSSLEDEMKRDERASATPRERRLFYAVVTLVSIILFGGLYAGLRYME